MRVVPLLTCLLTLGACQEYQVNPTNLDAHPAPVILANPGELVFPMTLAGDTATMPLELVNLGDAVLSVQEFAIEGSEAFTVVSPAPGEMQPGATAQILLQYRPESWTDEAALAVVSNDPATPTLRVPLFGDGGFPELAISPDHYDFGWMDATCEHEQPLTLTNVGESDLVIDAVAHVGVGFQIVEAPYLPITLGPGDSTAVTVAFSAFDIGDYEGTLHVSSNEPGGLRTATQTATVEPPQRYEQTFRQPGAYEGVDVIFWIDGSGSMTDDQTNLADNFEQFTSQLEYYTADWQIMAVSDSGCRFGDIITPATVDKAAAFEAAVKAGRGWEAGLGVSLYAVQQTGAGECNDGYLRDDAKTLVVLVTDEPEQSGRNWSDVTNDILAEAPSTTISAIAGDVPAGCSTAAAGYGYYEAVGATGGQFLSICDADWGSHLKAIADTATAGEPTDTFVLDAEPDPDTIVVTIDGVPDWAWSYDAPSNAVVYPTELMPPEGSEVKIRYEVLPDCDG